MWCAVETDQTLFGYVHVNFSIKMCNSVCNRDDTLAGDLPVQEVKEVKPHKTLQRLKTEHNLVTDPTNEEKQKEVEYQPDLLAVSTQLSKVAYDVVQREWSRFKLTNAYV